MKRLNMRTAAVIISLIVGTMMLSGIACGAPKSRDSTWVLTQVSDKHGAIVVYIHDDQVRVDKLASFSAICKAPSWNVILFNSKRRIINERTLANWLNRGLYIGLEFLHPPNEVGHHANVIDRNHVFKYRGVDVFRGVVFTDKKNQKLGHQCEFLVAPAITANVHVFEFLRTFLEVDIPLECATIFWQRSERSPQEFMQSGGAAAARGVVHDIQTTDIRQKPYQPKDFAAPANFKKVPDSEIVMGPKNELIDNFLPP